MYLKIKIAVLLIMYSLAGAVHPYTFNEDILEKCGAKHPNDFVGRYVCNNNMQTELCLSRERIKLKNKFDEIAEVIEKNADKTLTGLYPLIQRINDDFIGNEKKLNAKVVDRDDKQSEYSDDVEKVITIWLDSKCSDNIYYPVNIREDAAKTASVMLAWMVNRNAKDNTSNVPLSGFTWRRSDHELAIAKYQDIAICRKNSLSKFKSSNSSIESELKSNNTYSVAKITLQIMLMYDSPLYGYSSKDFDSGNKTTTRRITIQERCDTSEQATSNEYKLLYNESGLLEIKSKLNFHADNHYSLIWQSADKLAEIRQLKEEKLRLEKQQREQDRLNKILGLILFAIIFLGYIYYKFSDSVKSLISKFAKKSEGIEPTQTNSHTESDSFSLPEMINEYEEMKKSQELKKSEELDNLGQSRPLHEGDKLLSKEDNERQQEFRAKYPFVTQDVPIELINKFIEECAWFEEKRGHFPDRDSQAAILASLVK